MKYFVVLVIAIISVTYVMAGIPVPCISNDDCNRMCKQMCIPSAVDGVCAVNNCFCMLISDSLGIHHG